MVLMCVGNICNRGFIYLFSYVEVSLKMLRSVSKKGTQSRFRKGFQFIPFTKIYLQSPNLLCATLQPSPEYLPLKIYSLLFIPYHIRRIIGNIYQYVSLSCHKYYQNNESGFHITLTKPHSLIWIKTMRNTWYSRNKKVIF